MIKIFVHGTPKPQPRPRAFARGGHAKVYDPGTAEGWKGLVAQALQPWAGTRTDRPLAVCLAFRFGRPAGHTKLDGTLRRQAPRVMSARPDLDNLAKAVMDCCTQIGIWKDDSQVVELQVSKTYAQPAGCFVSIDVVDHEDQ